MYSLTKEEKSHVFKYFQNHYYSRQNLVIYNTKEKQELIHNPSMVFKVYPAISKIVKLVERKGRIRKRDFDDTIDVLKEFMSFYESVESVKEVYSYEQVTEALNKIRITDPGLYKVLWYSWFTDRSIVDISCSLYMDSSTFKRKCDKAISLVLGYLRNPEIMSKEHIKPIDLINPTYT